MNGFQERLKRRQRVSNVFGAYQTEISACGSRLPPGEPIKKSMEERADKQEQPTDYWLRHDRQLKLRSALIASAIGVFSAIATARFIYNIDIPLIAFPATGALFTFLWRLISSQAESADGE